MLFVVNGQIGSGKDALFERAVHLYDTDPELASQLPGRPERLAFADKLKRAVEALFGVSRDFIEQAKRDDLAEVVVSTPRFGFSRRRGLRWTRHFPGLSRVHSRMTVRLALQRMGTEVGRNIFGDSFWVDQCVPLDIDHSRRVIFVTDGRFPNEVERGRAVGGVVPRVRNGPLSSSDGHASEQILPAESIDVELDNSRRDDGFAQLDAQVREILLSAAADVPLADPPTKPKVVERPMRSLGNEVALDDLTKPKYTNIDHFSSSND